MTFERYIFINHFRVNIQDDQNHFTLDDMKECWNAAANNIGQAVIDLHDGKFDNLPHRSEDEQQ